MLSIFLLKAGVAPEQVILEARDTTATPVRVGYIHATLYTTNSEPHMPDWAWLFRDAIDLSSLQLQTASASAVLVVPMANRTFAVTFGHGRHLVDQLLVEPTFGLRAVLNSISEESIRWIDKKTFEGISTHTQEQASKDTSLADFGLDVERDVVRAVCGTPFDATLGARLKGKDSLTATCDMTLDTLPELLQAFFAQSELSDYRTKFPWVDNVLEVRDKIRQEELDAELVQALRAGGNEKIWLTVPELIDWGDVREFSYGRRKQGNTFRDLHLRDYLNQTHASELDAAELKRRKIYGFRASSDAKFGAWSVYECIHAEIETGDGTFLLSGSQWYRLDRNFVATIDRVVSQIPASTTISLAYRDGEREAQYNARLAASIVGASCVDAKLIQYGGGRSRIEFCDVYHPGYMIHVKRYAGSSVLSHLFAQGTVSATAFLSDERFRAEVNKKLPPSSQISTADRPSAAAYEVAFVIASRSAHALALPFFSRVTLRNAYIQLSNFGYRMTLTKIGVV